MQFHQIVSPKGANKKRKLLGRGSGSGHGKTSGRGHKGQNARSGRSTRLGFEGGQMPLVRRIPKRGFTSKTRREFQIVNLKDLQRIKENTIITPEFLKEKGLIKNTQGWVKILGAGELNRPLTIKAHSFSKSAQDKIKSIGGRIEIVDV
jgi:large subunit ribosomal protein L15